MYICPKKTKRSLDMYETDNTDLKIIDLLMEDGRMPAAEIARRVGDISERVVRYRIERMVADGLINISAIINPKKFGFLIVADIVIEVEPSHISYVAQKIAEYENVSYVACSIGEMDVSVQVFGRDATEVYTFATEVIGKMPGVRKTTTSIVPIVLKDVYQWRVPRRERAGLGEKGD
jgi:Lrp/AsnC family transcriptional regulator for asnA, asnC and gidA